MPPSDPVPTLPPGVAVELLSQARAKAVELLNRLLAEQADAEWQPAKPTDKPQAVDDWRHAMIAATESAKRAVAAIEAAMKVASNTERVADSHQWN